VQIEKYTGLQCLKDGLSYTAGKKNMVCSLRGPLNKGVRPLFQRVHRAGNLAFCLKMEDGYKMSDNGKCSFLKQFLCSQLSSARNKQRGRMERLIYFPGNSQNVL